MSKGYAFNGDKARKIKRRIAHIERQREQGRLQIERLTRLVSEGYSVAAAGRAIGISQQRSSQLWKRVRDELGWQAC